MKTMLTTATNFPMPIVTPRLTLCQPDVSGAKKYFDAVTESMNEIKLWLPWARYYPTISQVEEYIRECGVNWVTKTNNNFGLPLWIIEKESGEFIGNITMWNINWDIPKFEFGYWCRTSKTKNGYITEAVNALTQYCFTELGVRRIEIRCEINNIRAQVIPKSLGFDLDGILRNSTIAVSNGELTDTIIFSCTNPKNLPALDGVLRSENN